MRNTCQSGRALYVVMAVVAFVVVAIVVLVAIFLGPYVYLGPKAPPQNAQSQYEALAIEFIRLHQPSSPDLVPTSGNPEIFGAMSVIYNDALLDIPSDGTQPLHYLVDFGRTNRSVIWDMPGYEADVAFLRALDETDLTTLIDELVMQPNRWRQSRGIGLTSFDEPHMERIKIVRHTAQYCNVRLSRVWLDVHHTGNDLEPVLVEIRRINAMAESCDYQLFMINALVSTSIHSVLLDNIRVLATYYPLPSASNTRVMELVDSSQTVGPVFVLKSKRFSLLQTIEDGFSETFARAKSRSAMIQQVDSWYAETLPIVNDPTPKKIIELQQIDAQRDASSLVVDMLIPAFGDYLSSQQRLEVESQGTRVVVAIASFKQDNGRLPDALTELIPTYLDGLPVAPFGSEDWIYRVVDPVSDSPQDPTSIGYTLYLIGYDGIDNGGQRTDWSHFALGPDGEGQDYVVMPPDPYTLGVEEDEDEGSW